MNVPFYGHVRQYNNIKKEIDANISEVIESGQYVMGPMLKRFEQELATYHGSKHAIGVGNGTDALWLVFMALGIGPGDECITHTNKVGVLINVEALLNGEAPDSKGHGFGGSVFDGRLKPSLQIR